MLNLKGVDAFYGRIQALRSVSLHVKEGEVVSLIGANGAGKTTLLSVISGLLPAKRGEVLLDRVPIHRLPPARIVQRGVIQAPEGRRLFGPLTVRENLELGAYARFRRIGRKKVEDEIDRICNLFPLLKERINQPAGTLSGGEQQMLAIGRGLMGAPRLLLLDEPSLGLAPLVVAQIFATVRRLKAEGVTILLVEQNARGALAVSDRGYVLETGRVTLTGDSAGLAGDPEVRRAFLGKDYRDKREIGRDAAPGSGPKGMGT